MDRIKHTERMAHGDKEGQRRGQRQHGLVVTGLPTLEGTAVWCSHPTRAPALGSFLWSTSTPPRCEAGVASPRAPLILALQKLLDLRQNRGAQIQFPQGAGERAKDTCSQHLALPTTPHLPSPVMATHAFWLTMLRRSTTTDRSLMATAESTDVCANRAPVSGDQGHSGPAWV